MSESTVVPIRDDVEIPDFVTRVDISKMTDPKLDEFIAKIKLRRMSSFIVYQQTLADAESADQDKAKDKLLKSIRIVFFIVGIII